MTIRGNRLNVSDPQPEFMLLGLLHSTSPVPPDHPGL